MFKAIAFIVLCFVFIIFLQEKYGLGNGYKYIRDRTDDMHISKNDKVVVGSTIIDLDSDADYIVGLQLPSSYLECENGSALKIVLKNQKKYFILSIETGDVIFYSIKKAFNDKLESLNIKRNISLDYSRFEAVWRDYSDSYKNTDFSTCRSIKRDE